MLYREEMRIWCSVKWLFIISPISRMSKLVIYQGVQYNIMPFAGIHPGGTAVIDQFLAHKQDITEVFKSTHSKRAEERLLCLEETGKADRSKFQRIYCKLEEQVKRFYSPNYFIEVTVTLVICAIFITGFFFTQPLVVIATTSVSQVVAAWSTHSQLHSRNRFLTKMGKIMGGAVMGLSHYWWLKKHHQHHAFTNREKMDPDIAYNYPVCLYPFLLIKWRIESILTAVRHIELEELVYLTGHYMLVFFRVRVVPGFLGLAVASMYIAVVTQGNHVREDRFRGDKLEDFLVEQLSTTRNYEWRGGICNFLLGGFNFHVEHHLFPRVPYYRLQEAHRMLEQQLSIYKLHCESGEMLV